MYFEKLTRKRDTLIQSIRMSESQPEIFNEVSNSRITHGNIINELRFFFPIACSFFSTFVLIAIFFVSPLLLSGKLCTFSRDVI